VVDRDVDLKVTARRIAWGKWTNCGQTCIAPDYIMCEKGMQDGLIKELQTAVCAILSCFFVVAAHTYSFVVWCGVVR
jgi:acyl-CoA reductase-like NAD-dependent aldehyde dehydrogenase